MIAIIILTAHSAWPLCNWRLNGARLWQAGVVWECEAPEGQWLKLREGEP